MRLFNKQNRNLITKVGNKYSSWRHILSQVPQGSILGPLLFNIYIYDLFLLVNDTNINYADDKIPYVNVDKISTAAASLERSTDLIFNWFTDMRTSAKCFSAKIKRWK